MTAVALSALLVLLASGCSGSQSPPFRRQVFADSLVTSGILLKNQGDTAFTLWPRWDVRGIQPYQYSDTIWQVSERLTSRATRFEVIDSSVMLIDGRRILPLSPGRSRIRVAYGDAIDTVAVIVGRVGTRLVAMFDSTSLPRRPAYHDSSWDTIGGWWRLGRVKEIAEGVDRDTVIARLGRPCAVCITRSTGILTDSWAITTSTTIAVQSLEGKVVRWYVADFQSGLDGQLSE